MYTQLRFRNVLSERFGNQTKTFRKCFQKRCIFCWETQGTIGAPLVENSRTGIICGVSLSDSLFSFVLEKYYACSTCKLHSPSFEQSNFVNITPFTWCFLTGTPKTKSGDPSC